MLSKNFSGKKIYKVTRYTLKDEKISLSKTVWDSLEKAKQHIKKYSSKENFNSANIEVVFLKDAITSKDYKEHNYKVIATRRVYTLDSDLVEKTKVEKIQFVSVFYKVSGYSSLFNTLAECEKFAERVAEEKHKNIKILRVENKKIEVAKVVKYKKPIPYDDVYFVKSPFGYSVYLNDTLVMGCGSYGSAQEYKKRLLKKLSRNEPP